MVTVEQVEKDMKKNGASQEAIEESTTGKMSKKKMLMIGAVGLLAVGGIYYAVKKFTVNKAPQVASAVEQPAMGMPSPPPQMM